MPFLKRLKFWPQKNKKKEEKIYWRSKEIRERERKKEKMMEHNFMIRKDDMDRLRLWLAYHFPHYTHSKRMVGG